MRSFIPDFKSLASKLSIRLLVIMLATASVAICILLGLTAIISNNELAKGQASLVRMSSVQDSSAQMVKLLNSFQQRKAEILAANNSAAISKLGNKDQLIGQYQKTSETLRGLAADNKDLNNLMDEIDLEVKSFFSIDDYLYENRKEIIRYEESIFDFNKLINKQLDEIDSLVGEISGKVNYLAKKQDRAVRKLVRKINKSELYVDPDLYQRLKNESSNLVSGDSRKRSKVIDEVKYKYLSLSSLSREIININNVDELISLKSNRVDQLVDGVSKDLSSLEKLFSGNDDLKNSYGNLKNVIDEYLALSFLGEASIYEIKTKIISGKIKQKELILDFNKDSNIMNNIIDELIKYIAKERKKVNEENLNKVDKDKQLIFLVSSLATVFLVLVSFFLIRIINIPLSKIATALNDIAKGDGDLTQRLDTNSVKEVSVIATTFNNFVEKISATIKQVSDASEKLSLSSEDLKVLSGNAKIDAETQKNETEKAALAVTETAQAAGSIAKTTEETSLSSEDVRKQANDGSGVVENVVSVIERLAVVVEQSKNSIGNLENKSAEIGSVLDVIRSIAEQTNLLALNAAIEAARAGEQGRGFAVVADEVRSLANRTQQSTVEIEGMIKQLQEGSKESASLIQEGDEIVDRTVEQAKQASQALAKIINSISSVSESSMLIASAAEEQSIIAKEVSINVDNIRVIGDKSVQNTDKIMASARDLGSVSDELKSLMLQFKV